ncbi:GntR family transcriptional regulator, partial [Streptomyces calidiresistens]|uniref:GntR family transcriptional regulator n=1 Tax=Streptomyces calidiresistens TaxID=1485586 RepID=UPI001E6581A1
VYKRQGHGGPTGRPRTPAGDPGDPGAGDSDAGRPRGSGARPAVTPRAPGHTPVPPVRHCVRDQVLAALRGALADGGLRPGEVYSAPQLAVRWGVSAGPVREAMHQLMSEGTVEAVPNRGFRVCGLTPRDLAELAELRAALEVPAITALARDLPPGHWAALRPLADAAVTAAGLGDGAAYAEADLAFHRELLAPAGNRQLSAVTQHLHRRSQAPVIGRPPRGAAELLADALEHGALLDALASGSPSRAERMAREHLTGC